MLSSKEVVNYWAKKLGLDQDEKTAKKRITLRKARQRQRQDKYGKKLGHRAVKNQRKKKKLLRELYQGK